jgi:hypothetical protein
MHFVKGAVEPAKNSLKGGGHDTKARRLNVSIVELRKQPLLWHKHKAYESTTMKLYTRYTVSVCNSSRRRQADGGEVEWQFISPCGAKAQKLYEAQLDSGERNPVITYLRFNNVVQVCRSCNRRRALLFAPF